MVGVFWWFFFLMLCSCFFFYVAVVGSVCLSLGWSFCCYFLVCWQRLLVLRNACVSGMPSFEKTPNTHYERHMA